MPSMQEENNTHRSAAPTIGIVGLGLIGGSFARAYLSAGARVYAYDIADDVMEAARIDGVAGTLNDETIAQCDLIVLAAYPAASLTWLEEHAERLGELTAAQGGMGPLAIDTAGVKQAVCERAFELARLHGFAFVGTHPMAGTEHSGYAWARADLFHGAPMVLVPPEVDDMERLVMLDRLHTLLKPLGFSTFSTTTPEEHDRVIAFTSQLAHVVSNAYVKSPTAREHHGFSAGSYRDLTRVAHLNPTMWCELMNADAPYLIEEIDRIVRALTAYRDALAAGDTERLRALLAEGDRIKRSLDDNAND